MDRAIATPSQLRFAVNRATQLHRVHHNACVSEQAQRELLTHLILRRDCAFHHSISNTGPITVGVLSEGAIGIDVEVENRRIGVSPPLLMRRMFSTEQEAAECLERWSLLQLWTIKEAVLKASGFGLAGGLSNVALNRQRDSAECFGQVYGLTMLRWHQYLITIAAKENV